MQRGGGEPLRGDLRLSRLQPREAQHEAGDAQRRRAEGGGAAQRGAGGAQGGADDQRDQHLQVGHHHEGEGVHLGLDFQDQAGEGAGGDGGHRREVSEA